MEHQTYRDTWVDISLVALKGNVTAFKNYINEKSKMMAVVKADGYGHGAVEIAEAALEAGADYLAVAILEEAIALRNAGIQAPILVLGYTHPTGSNLAIEQNITLTVFRKDSAEALVTAANRLQKKAKVHIKVDTGMTRVGLTEKHEILELIDIFTGTNIAVEGIFTHFADADSRDETYTNEQFSHFQDMTTELEKAGHTIPLKHCCNSAATIAYPAMHLDMCRVGISLYGLYPAEHLREKINLTQVMSFKTKPAYIKKVSANETISYGRTFTAERESLIATLPVGYADGLNRQLSNHGSMTVKQERVPIVGRICMDQTMVDVTNVADVTSDEVFTIFGDPSEGFIGLDEIAEQLQTIHYEIVCLIGKRVPRVYRQ